MRSVALSIFNLKWGTTFLQLARDGMSHTHAMMGALVKGQEYVHRHKALLVHGLLQKLVLAKIAFAQIELQLSLQSLALRFAPGGHCNVSVIENVTKGTFVFMRDLTDINTSVDGTRQIKLYLPHYCEKRFIAAAIQ